MTKITAPVAYLPNFVQKPQEAFNALWNELDWVDRAGPRLEYYSSLFNLPYTYGEGKFAREYQPQPIHKIMQEMWIALELSGLTMDMCFLNGYRDGRDHLGWHADVTDDNRPIAIISLGASREIWFRKNPCKCYACAGTGYYDSDNSPNCGACDGTGREPNEVEKLVLEDGSLCLMKPGMQLTHQHRIPKSSLHQCGPRISLTFRGHKKG